MKRRQATSWWAAVAVSAAMAAWLLGTSAAWAADGADTSAGGDAAVKLEKQLAAAEERYTALQTEELELSVKLMQAQQQALAAVENPSRVNEELAKGGGGKGVREYRSILMASAAQWRAFEAKIKSLDGQTKTLARERDKAPAALQGRIDQLVINVGAKHRAVLEKIADAYDKVGDYRNALTINLAILNSVPEDKRAAERTLVERIATLHEKSGDLRKALETYLSVYKTVPENKRGGSERKLTEAIAGLCEKLGDPKAALDLLRLVYNALPKDKKEDEKQEKGLKDKIAKLEGLVAKAGPRPKSGRSTGGSNNDNGGGPGDVGGGV